LDYAEKCDLNIDGMCKPGLACRCDKYTEARCLCPDGHYFLGNNCIYALQTKLFPTETSVSLDIHNVGLNLVSHQLIWSTCSEIREKLTKITREVISGLTPGQEYNVKIISTLAADTYNDPIFLKSNFIVITLPAQPGEVLGEESNLNTPPYVLKFNSSQGIVHHYNITLVSDTQVLIYQVKEAELVTSDLTADTLYNYTITAFNKLGNESTTFRGNVTTGPDKSVSVGVIAGITISVIVLLCCVAVGIVVLDRKRRTQITHFLRLCLGNIRQHKRENNGSLSKSRNKKASSGGRQLKSDPKDNKHSYDVVIVPSSPDVAGLYRDLNQSTPAENCYANSSAVKKYLDSSIYEDM
ncbi:phosphatidylinositol phosphatase PTPRQ, partial [Biomphalaria glabrata]